MSKGLKRSGFTLEDIIKMYEPEPLIVDEISRFIGKEVSQEEIDIANAAANAYWEATLFELQDIVKDDPGPYDNQMIADCCFNGSHEIPQPPHAWQMFLATSLFDIACDFTDFDRDDGGPQFAWDIKTNRKIAFGPLLPR